MRAYGLKHKDDKVLLSSSSGGAFTAFSDYILEKKGVVIGAIYDCNSNSVKHIVGRDVCSRDLMKGSKYIQSDIGEVYRHVKELLQDGELVLFTGTICQVNGLLSFLNATNTDRSKLITIDIICHGVGSPLIWRKYIESKMDYYKIHKVDSVCFRDKSEGWKSSRVIFKSNGKEYSLQDYMQLYYGHSIMRPSCYACGYTDLKRASDVTIGDFWGINESHPEFFSTKGNSFVLTNTEKGNELLEKINYKKEIDLIECKVEDVLQPNFYHPAHKSIISKNVWQDFYKNGIQYVINVYVGKGFPSKIRIFCKKIFAYVEVKLRNEN